MSHRKARRRTGEISSYRRERSELRVIHKKELRDGSFEEALPSALAPELFSEIVEIYWNCLRSVKDPRDESSRIYPLDLILHRIVSGLLSGTQYIGVLFPRKQRERDPEMRRQLGALPTRPAVYSLLRRIDWDEANVVLAPLWERLGYVPALVVQRKLRDPQVILAEFRSEQRRLDTACGQPLPPEREATERFQGMSATVAKPGGSPKAERDLPKREVIVSVEKQPHTTAESAPTTPRLVQEPHRVDLLLDGKVVKASYNMEVQERFVHVTHTQVDADGKRQRHIVGARETQRDRHGEWGAGLSVLDALLPLPQQSAILVSGDAGFCVREFCKWLTVMGFFFFSESNKTPEICLIVCWMRLLVPKKNVLMVTILNPRD